MLDYLPYIIAVAVAGCVTYYVVTSRSERGSDTSTGTGAGRPSDSPNTQIK